MAGVSAKASCGPQTTIVNTDGVRIARCPCGTFHVTLVQSGVTVQLSAEKLGELGRAIAVAAPVSQPGVVRTTFGN